MGWPERQTCETLDLNLAAGYAGNLDEVLPEDRRNFQGASELALPTMRTDLAKLCKIVVPPDATGPGAVYLKRAADRYMKLQAAAPQRRHGTQKPRDGLRKTVVERARKAINKSIQEVRLAADIANRESASITRLFDLCRQAVEGQLQAHLQGATWKGELINARAARECFRLVAQSVNSLNLPSDQRKAAADATMKEIASAIEATKDALVPLPAPPPDEPTH